MADWRPSAALAALQRRAAVIAQIRQFFAVRGVLEVETPILSVATATDPHLASFATECTPSQPRLYLHTSPEFPMKRLLAAGVGSMYQICKAFRAGERGRWHNPEFTLLEWYRIGFDHHALMDEMDAFLAEILGCPPAQRVRYRDVFRQHIGIDPLDANIQELQETARALGIVHVGELERDAWLDLLLTQRIESALGRGGHPTFVYDYPASQCAMARVNHAEPGQFAIAERFEVYLNGVELANGFHELQDAQEQRQRLEADRTKRSGLGLPLIPVDERLLAALEYGLPECAGVALGIDRLLMALLGATTIEEVIAFPIGRA